MQFNTSTNSYHHYDKTDSYMTHNSDDATGMMGNKRELEILGTHSENNSKNRSMFSLTDKTSSVQYAF